MLELETLFNTRKTPTAHKKNPNWTMNLKLLKIYSEIPLPVPSPSYAQAEVKHLLTLKIKCFLQIV